MSSAASAEVESCSPSNSSIILDGRSLSLTGYRINGNNFYRLRDVGKALDFGVDFDEQTRTVLIDSCLLYTSRCV